MATVPTLESPTVEQQPLPGRPYPRMSDEVTPGAYGAPLAAGLENLSSDVAQVQANDKIKNDNLRVIDANTQLEAGITALQYGRPDEKGVMQGGAFSLHGTDAINLPTKLLPEYDKMAQGISANLTPDQQRIFQRHVASGRNSLNLQLNRYEYEESNRLAGEVYSNGLNQAVEGASIGWRDPIAVGKSRADIKGLVSMQGDREGWDQSKKDAETQKWLAQMHYSVVDRMLADGKPQAALQYFVGTKQNPGIRDSNELTGEQSHQLGSAIDAAVRQQGAQMQAQVANQIRDVRAAAINGQLVPPNSMPSLGAVQAAYPDNWREIYSGIKADMQMGADMKAFGTMSPEEIRARQESYRPTSILGAAEGYERYNAMLAAGDRAMSDRAKDPRQYAIDNKLGSAPIDFKDTQAMGQELRTRLASIPTLSRQVGGYVPPLTKPEAFQLSQTLESMTPADRLRSLSQLRDGVQDDRGFQEVMRQILPGSPVTAIVGSQAGETRPSDTPTWFDHRFAANPADQVRILHGEQLLNPQGLEKDGEKKGGFKGGFPMPGDGGIVGLRQQFADRTRDLFRTRPELGDAYYSAFKAAYASLLSEKGDFSGNGNGKLRDQAIKIALGNLTEFNGQKVAVPQGMDPTKFEGLVRAQVVAHATALGAKPGFEAKIDGYQLRELGGLGSGRYELVNGNMPLTNPDGSGTFTVDLRGAYGGKEQDSEPPVSRAGFPKPSENPPPAAKAPPLHAGASGRGKEHPSQAPTT